MRQVVTIVTFLKGTGRGREGTQRRGDDRTAEDVRREFKNLFTTITKRPQGPTAVITGEERSAKEPDHN